MKAIYAALIASMSFAGAIAAPAPSEGNAPSIAFDMVVNGKVTQSGKITALVPAVRLQVDNKARQLSTDPTLVVSADEVHTNCRGVLLAEEILIGFQRLTGSSALLSMPEIRSISKCLPLPEILGAQQPSISLDAGDGTFNQNSYRLVLRGTAADYAAIFNR